MDIKTYGRAAEFISLTEGLLRSDEVRYGLIYGIARRVAENPHCYGNEDAMFYIVSDGAAISALAWRTPPHLVGLGWRGGDPKEAVSALIESIYGRWQNIPGVSGHREITDPFAERWTRVSGAPVQSIKSQRIYRLDSINPVSVASGRMRLATLSDRDLVSKWRHAFSIDTHQESDGAAPDNDTAQRIGRGEIYIWEDSGKPVSMACKHRPTEHGMAVGLVYTPPELRQRGYATACVSGVCREILKDGYDFCTLYTDLSNPTSNSIYMKIGFTPVCDSVQYDFSNASPTR